MADKMADAEDSVKDVLTAPAEAVKERVPFYASRRYLVLLRVIYIANVLVAGYVGGVAFFSPRVLASRFVFGDKFEQSDAFQLVGALWLAITFLSIIGIFKPILMSPVLLLQLFYKASWLFAAWITAVLDKQFNKLPWEMSMFFIAWVFILPFAIPWQHLAAPGDIPLRPVRGKEADM